MLRSKLKRLTVIFDRMLNNKIYWIFREQATSVSAGFHVAPLFWSQFGVLIFVEGGKQENPDKNPRSRDENQQQSQPIYATRPEPNPGHIGGRRALSSPRHPCSLKTHASIVTYSVMGVHPVAFSDLSLQLQVKQTYFVLFRDSYMSGIYYWLVAMISILHFMKNL